MDNEKRYIIEQKKDIVRFRNSNTGIGEILAIEEMGELIQAISKMQRCRKKGLQQQEYLKLMENITEEIADVKIAIDQLIYDWSLSKMVKEKEKEKINRTFERMQRGEE